MQELEAAQIDRFMERYPSRIEGSFGTSDTSAYLDIRRSKMSDFPYRESEGHMIRAFAEYSGAPHPTELPAIARVVVRGSVVAIGLPHFNSSDGAFWDGPLVGGAAEDGAWGISREVLFRVDEVLGSLLPDIREGSYVTFRLPGGQIAVTLTDAIARQLGYGSGGVYVFAEEPPVDMSVGEESVVFLDLRRRTGLFDGVLGYRYELSPSHFTGFKYEVYGDRLVPPGTPEWAIDIEEIRSLVEVELGRRAEPDPIPDEVFPLKHKAGPSETPERADYRYEDGIGDLPDEFPDSFPLPPEAESCGWMMRIDGSKQDFSVCLFVETPFDQLVAYFEQNLTARGWSTESWFHPSEGGRVDAFRVSRNQTAGRLEIVEEGPARSTVYIDVTRDMLSSQGLLP